MKLSEEGVQRGGVAEVFEAQVEGVGVQEAEVQLEAGGVGSIRRGDSRHDLGSEGKAPEV